MYKLQGWVEKGNTVIQTGGLDSTTVAQGSFPSATVTVYIHGTVTLAQIYSDDNASPTPLANPFTANADGSFGFYAASARYDIVFTGGTLPAPYTLNDVTNGAGGGSGNVVGPVSAVNNDIAVFDGATGTLIKDSGSTIASLAVSLPSLNNGRLTLASGQPNFAPQPATPSSTNTGTDIVTFAADPGWPTGTIVTPASTLAGLTAGTRYFFGRLTSLTGAFYTSVANANSNTSKVDLTASVTQQIIPSGISQTSIIFTPFDGDKIALFDGSATWNIRTFVETTLALGTLTSGLPYDVFGYDNSGTLALELLAWSGANTRATAIVQQNGVWVKSGATTRRLLGTIYTDSTTTTIDDAGGIASQVGGKRFVSNADNFLDRDLRCFDGTASWTYNSGTWRQSNGAAGNKVEIVTCLPRQFRATFHDVCNATATNVGANSGINIDSITAQPFTSGQVTGTSTTGELTNTISAMVSPGYHFAAAMEAGTATATSTHIGRSGLQQSGIVSTMPC